LHLILKQDNVDILFYLVCVYK